MLRQGENNKYVDHVKLTVKVIVLENQLTGRLFVLVWHFYFARTVGVIGWFLFLTRKKTRSL